MAQAQVTHHVVLNSIGYIVKNYHKRDITPYSIKMGSGDVKYSDQTVYQTLVQENWKHGFGFSDMDDPEGYAFSDDGIDTRFKNKVTIATCLTDASTMDSGLTCYPVRKFIEYGGSVYSCTSSGVYKWDGAKWVKTDATGLQTGDCYDALNDGQYLYVTLNGTTMKRFDGSSWTDNELTASDMQWLSMCGGYVWVSDDALPFVHYGSQATVTEPVIFEGGDPNAGGDPDASYIGAGNIPINGIISWNNSLYVGREDGLWHIPNDAVVAGTNPTAYKSLEYYEERHSRNFQTMAVFQGALYFTVRNELWRMTGLTILNVSPPEYKYEYPYFKYGNFRYLTPVGNFLYVVADEDDGTSTNGYGDLPYGEGGYGGASLNSVLMAYDEVGWHRLLELCSGNDTVAGMNYTPENNKLWISINKATGSDEIYYVPFRSGSDFPYSSYETTTSPPDDDDNPHYLYMSQFDATLATVIKDFSALTIYGQFNENKTIDVWYSLDGGTWVNLGTAIDNDSNVQRFEFSAVESLRTGKNIRLRLNLQTTAAATTPVLQRVVLQYLPRPKEIYSYDFDVMVADNIKLLDGTKESTNTAKVLHDALITARESIIPIEFYDRWGEAHSVNVASVDWRPNRFESGSAASPNELEGVFHVTLVEATYEGDR